VERGNVAMPAARFAVPTVVPLSEKITDPVGVLTGEEIVAIRVTVFCIRTGFGEAVSPATATPLFTVMEWVASAATA
jgi:hypothetical protein